MNKQKNINRFEQVDPKKLSLKINSFDLIETKITLNEVKWIIFSALKILRSQSTVLHLSGPLKIVGDICGHYQQLAKIFEIIGNPENKNYLFLGNYVAKGPNSIQSLVTLLHFKIKYPTNFFMLRGRFQMPQNNFTFGFYEECLQKYDLETWMNFNELFNYLPLGAIISNQIYCMSSGIAAPIKNISQLKNIVRNSQILQIPEVIELLESKPQRTQRKSFLAKSKGQFSSKTFFQWINQNKISLVIRSNQVLEQGFQFSMKNMLLTICSVPNFLKVQNLGAIVTISQDLVVSFQILK